MRRASRVDTNQQSVILEAKKLGATVQPLHMVGQGCPDLIIGFRGHNLLVEIKDGTKPPSARKLTPQQKDWHQNWRGNVYVITHWMEVINLIKSCSAAK